jgi:hypothetical protein
MHYSKEDLEDLIKFLDSFGETYMIIKEFFEFVKDTLKTGLTEPYDSFSTAAAVEELKDFYPDAYRALSMPDEDLPMFIDPHVGQEYPIACWRLKRLGPKQ